MEKSKINHKTLFLLDQTSNFVNRSCEQPIEFDVFTKNRSAPTGIIPLPPICKSIWTSTVESLLEYSRIVWDIFPNDDKLLSFLVFNENGTTQLIDWNEQSLSILSNNFSQASSSTIKQTKATRNDTFLLAAIQNTLEQLAKFSPAQWNVYEKKKEINNSGRLIVITSFQNNNQVNNFIKVLDSSLQSFNKSVNLNGDLKKDSKLPINELHLVVLNTYPVTQEQVKVTEIELHNVSASLSCEIINVKSGTFIASRMITLLLTHYDLASTTVTGIPMKEEQNASSSANYDVEIVHSSDAHLDLIRSALTNDQNLKTFKEDVNYETVSLKWCTPKGSQVELHQCMGAFRITAVEINSRPSSCLINFLLSGRTVMLEIPKLKGKCISHMLSSHSGELFIHTLGFSKSIIDDPPSISEGPGGLVTDYRIKGFGELIKSMRLEKCKPSTVGDLPLEKAKQFLTKQTLYFPMTMGHSLIFSLTNHLQPILSLIPKDTLTVDEVNDCQNCLYQLIKLETKSSSNLPIPSALPKNIKKDDLYKLLWKELEYFIEQHATTAEHLKVLNCLKELNFRPDTSKENLSNQNVSTAPKKFSSIIDEGDLAWKEFDRYNNMTEKEKNDFNTNSNQLASDSLSMPDLKRQKLSSNLMIKKSLMMNGSLSLYGLNAKRLELESTFKKEFKGRQTGSNIAQLYTNLTELKPENPL